MAGGGSASGISVGWLVAIAICGGILLFTPIGLLLVWWVKRRNRQNARMVYGGNATVGRSVSMVPSSTTRLAKRPLLMGSFSSDGRSSSTSGLSSGMSLPSGLLPPMLPMFSSSTSSWHVPESHQTQCQPQQPQKARKKSMSWVLDEDDLHGPKINKNARDSWFERDSWLGLVPTLPNLRDEEERMEEVKMSQHEQQQQQQQQHHNAMLQRELHQGEYEQPSKMESNNAWPVRLPEQTHRRRASMVDINLKAILQSTELRLQHQRSRSQSVVEKSSNPMGSSSIREESPRSSHPPMPSHSSAHSWPSVPSAAANHVAALPQVVTSGGHGNPQNTSSNANATTSLIAVATQSLELPGGTSSPSKARANHWEQQFRNSTPVRPPRNPQRLNPQRQTLQQPYPRLLPHPPTTAAPSHGSSSPSPSPSASRSASPSSLRSPRSPQLPFPPLQHTDPFDFQQSDVSERRRSTDSDESSTLSTLWSVNEPEEKVPAIDDDPFVGAGHPGQRPLTFASALLSQKAMIHESLLLHPPGSFSIATHGGLQGSETFKPGSPLIIEPLTTAHMGNVQRHSQIIESDAMSEVEPSEASFESVSVHDSDSDATLEAVIRDTPDPAWLQKTRGSQMGAGGGAARVISVGASTIGTVESHYSSSPYDEREVMNLLMAAAATPRSIRSLPPPMSVAGPDGDVVSLGLAPRPRSVAYGGLTRQLSNSSSVYTTDTTAGGASEAAVTSTEAAVATTTATDVGSISTGSPLVRRAPATGSRKSDAPSVDHTISELRRMNSLVSSYSVASLTSTIATDADSVTAQGFPTPTSAPASGGKGAVARPRTADASISAATNRYQQYISMIRAGNGGRPTASPSAQRGNNSPSNNSNINKTAQFASPGRKNNLKGPILSPARIHHQQKHKIGESPGLYDKDGFLKDCLTEEQENVQYSPAPLGGKAKVAMPSAA